MFTWVTYNTEKKTQKLVVQHIHNFLTRERGSHNITKKIHTPTTRTHSTHILSSKSLLESTIKNNTMKGKQKNQHLWQLFSHTYENNPTLHTHYTYTKTEGNRVRCHTSCSFFFWFRHLFYSLTY